MTKKVISLIIAMVMLVSMATVTAFAEENSSEETDKEYLFYDRVVESLGTIKEAFYSYDEVYYHYADENDPNSEIDWVLINAYTYGADAAMVKVLAFDRVFVNDILPGFFVVGWGIYDVELDKLVPISGYTKDYSKYEGLEQVLEENKAGIPLGDADYDGELTVLDATFIQRAVAELCEFNKVDELFDYGTWGAKYDRPLNYISDIDGDGERTILDATAIQMKLAQVE